MMNYINNIDTNTSIIVDDDVHILNKEYWYLLLDKNIALNFELYDKWHSFRIAVK